MSIAVESPRSRTDEGFFRRASQLWARSEPEGIDARPVCARTDCGRRATTHFDLYCENVHLLVLGRTPIVQHILVNALRITIGILVLLAVSTRSSIPLYAVAGGLFFLFLVLPLRAFPVARIVAAAMWVTGFTLVAAAYENVLGRSSLGVALTVVLVSLLTVAVLAVFRDTTADDASGAERDLVAGRLACGFVGGFMLLLMAGILAGAGAAFQDLAPPALDRLSLLIGVVCLTGSVLVAACAGLVRGIRTAHPPAKPIVRRRGPFTPPRIPPVSAPRRPRFGPRDVFRRINFALTFALLKGVQGLVALGNGFIRSVWRGASELERLLAYLANRAWTFLVSVLRTVRDAALSTLRLCVRAVAASFLPLKQWARSSLAPTILIAGAAVLLVFAADRFRVYLEVGGLENAGVTLAALAVTPLAAAVLWWSATTARLSEPRASLTRFVMDVGPFVFLVALGLGWAIGILGWLGVGSIEPGFLTYAGTALVICASVFVSERIRKLVPWRWSEPRGRPDQ